MSTLVKGSQAGAITGITSKSRRYELESEGKFPARVKVGRSTYYVEEELRAWVEARIAERDARQKVIAARARRRDLSSAARVVSLVGETQNAA